MKDTASAARALSALGHETRLTLYRLLVEHAPQGLVIGDLKDSANIAPTTLNFHVKELVQAGLVYQVQEGRYIRCFADLDQMRGLIGFLTKNCCHGEQCMDQNIGNCETTRPYHVLFLCTGNSARSIIAEVLMNQMGKGKFKAFSAGSNPGGQVNPTVKEFLEAKGYDTSNLRSKSWEEFENGVPIDFVITVCDNAAGETCPLWPGHPVTAHWGMPDPAAVEDQEERLEVVRKVYQAFGTRINIFTQLRFEALNRESIEHETRKLGNEEVA